MIIEDYTGLKLDGRWGNPSGVCFWKVRRCPVLIPLLCWLESLEFWTVLHLPIFPCEKSTTGPERSGCCYGVDQGGLESSWERLLDAGYHRNADFASLSAHNCQLSGFQHMRWIWAHMCCLCCSHWQYFALNRVKNHQETSLTWKWKRSEVCAINPWEFLQTEFQVNV